MDKLDPGPWPCFTEEEGNRVREVLLSNKVNYWTGNNGRDFEKEFAVWIGTKYAIALANGSLALELALRSLNIREGDEVIVTSRTFLASASAIVNVGATPVFADVDKNSQNITPESATPLLTTKTRAIICVHLAGWPCDMDGFMELADKNGLFIIEDCAQAHGARYKGSPVGGIGHVGAWSFCQDKIMTTGGEGGMITLNDEQTWRKAWAYKDHGKDWAAVYEKPHLPGFRWLHESFGSNWRMTEMQAAIGRIQLTKMKTWNDKRLGNATSIWKVAQKCRGLRAPKIPKSIHHAAYKCYIFVEPNLLNKGWDRDKIMKEILKEKVACFSGTCSEVYLEKAFESTKFRPKRRLEVAKLLGETSLMFLVHPTLSPEYIKKTTDVISKVMGRASS